MCSLFILSRFPCSEFQTVLRISRCGKEFFHILQSEAYSEHVEAVDICLCIKKAGHFFHLTGQGDQAGMASG